MRLGFPEFSYGRADYGLAEARLVNLYVEATPAGPTKTARLQRPGLVRAYSAGSGPIWGMYQAQGVFSGDRFALSGDELYREHTLLGRVSVSRSGRFAASRTQLVLVCGGKAYCYDGTTFAQVTDPDLPAVSDVAYISGRFYYLQQDSDVWWFSALNDATSIDGLAFETAESAPDANVGAAILSDEVWFFGEETVEPWYQTGDASIPLQRSQGRKYSRGCAAQQSIVPIDNTLIWLGDDRVVYRAGAVPRRVSIHGVEARLRKCTAVSDVTAWATTFDGHAFYVLNIPGQGTFGLDLSTDRWSEWTSYDRVLFRVRCGIMVDGVAYLGDDDTGTVWRFDSTAFDDDGDPLERLASCNTLQSSGSIRCDLVGLQCTRGPGLEDGSDPQVQMRYSDNGGRSWSDWAARSLGVIGDYRQVPVWRRQGMMGAPGRNWEFRITDPVGVVFSGVVINEERP